MAPLGSTARYSRTVSDLPWHGVCDETSCERRFFCERLPDVAVRTRKTSRLDAALLAVALELGGRAGAKLAAELGRDALLRRAKSAPLPDGGKVRVLGADDSASRKGHASPTFPTCSSARTRGDTTARGSTARSARGATQTAGCLGYRRGA